MEDGLSFLRTAPGAAPSAFADIAARLLGEIELVVAGSPHRLREIEFYYQSDDHPDPFAHCDPLQKTTGRWYFHRESGGYRGGSFKGLDISFGPEGVFGGILIRTIETPDGREINGCSLCVDHLLATTGEAGVAALDGRIGERRVWDPSSPLHLRHSGAQSAPAQLSLGAPAARSGEILATARVGLTLQRMGRDDRWPRYLLAPYRFLSDPTISKGKVHTVIALHQRGLDAAAISAATRSPQKTVRSYLDAYQEGLALQDFAPFRGKKLGSADLCTLHGVWRAAFGG